MAWIQKTFTLKARSRGFHLITQEILEEVPEIGRFNVGLCHIFIHHTSASLTINENASPDVRSDFEKHMNVLVPEGQPYYRHTFEGADDMPAHIKGSLMGFSQTVPLKDGRLHMGTWQGIYLCEHRDFGGSRRLTVTLHGE